LLSLATIRSITTPLSEAVQLAQTIAAGDLSYAPPATGRSDELGRLMQSLALMTRQLRGLVGEVQGGVEAVAAASSQMAQDNSDLSDRTAHAAEQLKATVSSIENMVTLVTHSADSARHADQSAAPPRRRPAAAAWCRRWFAIWSTWRKAASRWRPLWG
jgi:methyl-accepting chemotaxis protein